MGTFVFQADHQEIARMETQARAVFESFMGKNDVKRSTATADSLSFGWLENAPEGDSFVGSYGRVFDVIVMNRSSRNTSSLQRLPTGAAAFRSNAAAPAHFRRGS